MVPFGKQQEILRDLSTFAIADAKTIEQAKTIGHSPASGD